MLPMVPAELMDKAKKSAQIEAKDLKCGDVFFFRDNLYVVLSNIRNEKAPTITYVTAVAQEDSSAPLQKVTVIMFFLTVRVPVCHRVPLSLAVLEVEEDEISPDALSRYESMKKRKKAGLD